jgi:hypothetical protein
MGCMEDNPYRSPESTSKLKNRPSNVQRHANSAFFGLLAFWGLFFFMVGITKILLTHGSPVIRPPAPLFATVTLIIASPMGALVGWWTWRAPESKWPVVVAMLLVSSPFLLAVIGLVFFR